ncbi:hypothetical protein [Arthrobacter glacialis]|uniref:hypothetical protein n=1 Tax=Arthrobacter glacialis TaxID=1664 RepID=UPI000CD47BB2|nr:hypothetical protein [Arthrobacter glacialis]POH58921.1 hypothetical protein CVS28_09440 [Arthrobacter glacialis]
MATLKHRKTGHTVTTSYAPEIVSLRAQGYAVVPEATPIEDPAADAPAVAPDTDERVTSDAPSIEAKAAGAVSKTKASK